MLSIRFIPLYFFFLFILISCQKLPNSEFIINESIQYSGGIKIDNSDIQFSFRGKMYSVRRNGGNWEMTRFFQDSSKAIFDSYANDYFTRTINDSTINVVDSMQLKYIESINSVLYFALLPYKLDDNAVISELLDTEEIGSEIYYKIKIRFKKEGGGVDHEDEFIYWFDIKDYSLDFLAYSFQVNGGGLRFRKAYNERFIDGIRFVDYENYKPQKNSKIKLEDLGRSYMNQELVLLSKIELNSIQTNQ